MSSKIAPELFGATFVGGPEPNAIVWLAGTNKGWFEVGSSNTVTTGTSICRAVPTRRSDARMGPTRTLASW